MSFEQAAYEIPEIWEATWFTAEDNERVSAFGAKVPRDAKSLLDVGCGNGLFLDYLATKSQRQFERLCGAERSQAALKHVKVEKHAASADALPFEDKTFDVVTSLEVIEHLPLHVYETALGEMARVARRHIVIGVPFDEDLRCGLTECPSCWCRFNANYHMRSFDEARVRTLFDGRGYVCKEVFFVHPTRKLVKSLARMMDHARLLRRNGSVFPGFAICPSCGYKDTSALQSAAAGMGGAKPLATGVRGFVRDRLMVPTYRWVGGVFERR
jgi:SAM-dependent methyltransferase